MRSNLLCMSSAAALSVVFSGIGSDARAQALSGEANAFEEIFVTAQRREQSIQDVPISMTVINQAEILTERIENISDYLQLSSNTSFSSFGTPSTFNVSIRGISNIGGNSNVVGIYVDEFNVAPTVGNSTVNQAVLNVDRIEVLRGPQGTFFGRNVTGGAINITTVKPGPDFGGTAMAEAANFDSYILRGSVNVPVTDTLFMRFSGLYENVGGFLENEGPVDVTNAQENLSARAALRYVPNERLTVDMSLTYTEFNQDFPDIVPTGVLSDVFLFNGLPVILPEAGAFPENTDTISANRLLESDSDNLVITSRIQYEGDAFDIVGVAGYIDEKTNLSGDRDGTNQDFFFLDRTLDESESFSIEARIQSNNASGLTWLFGGIYAEDKLTVDFSQGFGPAWAGFIEAITEGFIPAADVPINDLGFIEESRTKNQSIGLFGEVGWIDERYSLSASLRWQRDDIDANLINIDVNPFPFFEAGTSGLLEDNATFSQFLPRFAATYTVTDDVTIYGVAAAGGKPGGANLGAFFLAGAPTTFGEEKLWNFEVGAKGVLLDGSLRFNVAVFHTIWDDIQLTGAFTNEEFQSTILTQNYPDARSTGLEVDFAANVTDRLVLEGGAGFNDSEFGAGPNVLLSGLELEGPIEGNTLPLAPRWTANIAAQYTHPFSWGEAFLRGEYIYQGQRFTQLNNEPLLGFDGLPFGDTLGDNLIPQYDTMNIRAGVTYGAWSVVAFGENLINQNYITGFLADEQFAGAGAVINPRRYGVRVIADF